MKLLTSRWAVLALLLLLVGVRWVDPYLVQIARLKTFDYYQVNQQKEISNLIDVVQITDSDIEKQGRWPWPRDYIADAIRKLHEQGAQIVVVPILFSEPDEEPLNDQYLAEVVKNTILAQTPSNQATVQQGTKRGVAVVGGDPTAWLYKYKGIVKPLQLFEDNAAGVGIIVGTAEIDGVIRRVPMVVSINKELYPSLSLETIRVIAGDVSYQMKTTPGGIDSVRIPKVGKIKTDQNGRIWIAFNKSFNHLSLGDLDKTKVKGIVVLSLSAQGLATNIPTPLGLKDVGDVQASTIQTLVDGTFITRPLSADLYELAFIVLVTGILILGVPMIKYYYTIPLYLFVIGGTIYYGFNSYSSNILFDFSYPSFVFTLTYFYLVFNNFASEYKQKLQIKKQFEHYVSPKLVKKMQKHPEMLRLGGETKDLSILFSDLRGFTTLSEKFKTDPQGLTKLINRYLTPMTNVVQDQDGTLDKYIGDAIMAFWNAPLDDPEHKKKAILTSLEMFKKLEMLNEELAKEGFEKLQIGVGVNSGSVVVGNMGSLSRFDYTCLGDAVNLASRLEGQSKDYGVGVVIGSESVTDIDNHTFILLDTIAVKGKKEGVDIYTVLETMPKYNTYATDHNKFMAAYKDRNWQLAVKYALYLSTCWNGNLTTYYNMMIDRIGKLELDDPGTGWDGIYRAKTK